MYKRQPLTPLPFLLLPVPVRFARLASPLATASATAGEERGDVDDEILNAILGHATYSGTPRDTPMARHLFAVDELAGFIVACCKVRPGGISDLAPKSVKKKLKTANFAAAVNRDDIALGTEELGCDLTEHIQFCIDALRADEERLSL